MTLHSVSRRLGALVAAAVAIALVVFVPAGTASAAPGDFTASPTTLDFGDVTVGDQATLAITLTNTSAATATPSTAGSGVSGDMAMVGHCTDPVAPGGTCTVEITFRPTAVGPLTGLLILRVDGVTVPTTVTGNGVAPITYDLAPPSLDFGDVVVGESATLVATITNTSTVAASPVVDGTISGPFAFGSGTCLTTLDPGESCEGEIVFTPTTLGPAAGVADMTVDRAPIGSITLSGVGVEATTVTVADPDDTVPTDPPATPTDTATQTSTVTDTPRSQLPRTGSRTAGLALVAAVLLAFGASALTFRRVVRR